MNLNKMHDRVSGCLPGTVCIRFAADADVVEYNSPVSSPLDFTRTFTGNAYDHGQRLFV